MNDLKNSITICPDINCLNIPRINLLNNSHKIKITCNMHNEPNIGNFNISNYLSNNNNFESKLLCFFCSKSLKENEYFFYYNNWKKFICNQCYQNNIFHDYSLVQRTNLSNFWTKCAIHENPYIKYCKICNISLCKDCSNEQHKEHILFDIEQKNQNQIEEIKQNLSIQEKYFEIVKNIISNCLNQMKSELNLKRLILNNYIKNSRNWNSVENLNETITHLNQLFKQKIDILNNEENSSFEDKLLCLHYYYKMVNKRLNNNNLINKELYETVTNHKDITSDLINVINIEKDGNCLYRAISYFLFNDQINHSYIRKEIKERAQQIQRNNPLKLDLIENLNLSISRYINDKMNEGAFAGDYEISLAHQLYNINIVVYEKINDNEFSFINFYNDDGNNNRDLLILILENNNHYKLGYLKKKENDNIKKEKYKENLEKNQLKKEVDKKEIKLFNPIKMTNNNILQKKSIDSFISEKGIKISSFVEKSEIFCMIRLSSGNLTLGLSNGIIKIYDVNKICLIDGIYDDESKERYSLLTINTFKGKRISYLYELKDKTLLCATCSKIHHIQLKNGDKEFDYIDEINLTKGEFPKRIIELRNKLVVSLGEKIIINENLNKRECILKIFSPKKIIEEENSFCLLNDNESINSRNLNSNSDEWEEIYSFGSEDSSMNKEKMLKNDLNKNNKNAEKIFICSIFPITNKKNINEGNVFEFISTSNKTFKEGKNCIQFFVLLQNQEKKIYRIFIDKIIKDMPCSRLVDSICQLNEDYIAIGLQLESEESMNGIAILDKNKREIITLIRGLSIGLLNRNINNSKLIFFTTNQTKEVKKCNELRIYKLNNIMTDFLDKNKNKLIFQYSSSFSHLAELIPSKENQKIIFYLLSFNKKIFIIKIDNNIFD